MAEMTYQEIAKRSVGYEEPTNTDIGMGIGAVSGMRMLSQTLHPYSTYKAGKYGFEYSPWGTGSDAEAQMTAFESRLKADVPSLKQEYIDLKYRAYGQSNTMLNSQRLPAPQMSQEQRQDNTANLSKVEQYMLWRYENRISEAQKTAGLNFFPLGEGYMQGWDDFGRVTQHLAEPQAGSAASTVQLGREDGIRSKTREGKAGFAEATRQRAIGAQL